MHLLCCLMQMSYLMYHHHMTPPMINWYCCCHYCCSHCHFSWTKTLRYLMVLSLPMMVHHLLLHCPPLLQLHPYPQLAHHLQQHSTPLPLPTMVPHLLQQCGNVPSLHYGIALEVMNLVLCGKCRTSTVTSNATHCCTEGY
jgi:hypothetical protein